MLFYPLPTTHYSLCLLFYPLPTTHYSLSWIITGVAILLSLPAGAALLLVGLYLYLCWNHLEHLSRIFLEKPLFIIPRGQPLPEAEEVALRTPDALTLRGCYVKTTAPSRKGVILFGLEFGSNRWACGPYTDFLRDAGYDVFTYEPRCQGESDCEKGFEPLQWVTDREAADCRTALEYLKGRPDADPRGVGLFGYSKGANAGLVVAAGDRFIRCAVTDGAFGHHTVMVPYMRVWFAIYDPNYPLHGLFGAWYYGLIARTGVRRLERERGTRFPDVETALRKFGPRPVLMIHGADDTYIKADMARALFRYARPPKELWIVPNAKHNQAIQVAGDEYRRRVREFFDRHLAEGSPRRHGEDGEKP
jgi:pimeloyl-ACP methyl ester carboxylesterase